MVAVDAANAAEVVAADADVDGSGAAGGGAAGSGAGDDDDDDDDDGDDPRPPLSVEEEEAEEEEEAMEETLGDSVPMTASSPEAFRDLITENSIRSTVKAISQSST